MGTLDMDMKRGTHWITNQRGNTTLMGPYHGSVQKTRTAATACHCSSHWLQPSACGGDCCACGCTAPWLQPSACGCSHRLAEKRGTHWLQPSACGCSCSGCSHRLATRAGRLRLLCLRMMTAINTAVKRPVIASRPCSQWRGSRRDARTAAKWIATVVQR